MLAQAAMRKLSKPSASQVAGESQEACLAIEGPVCTSVPRGQPEIAIGLESQIEPWLPLKQHSPAADCGIRRTVVRIGSIDNDRR